MAYMYFNNLQINKAKRILLATINQFDKEGIIEDIKVLIGECYIILTYITFYENTLGGLEYIKKAVAYLPQSSMFLKKELRALSQNELFYLPQDKDITIEEMTEYFYSIGPYYERISAGTGYGLGLLFEAEAAYYQAADFFKVQNKAFQAIYKAKSMHQHDIVASAHYLLGKTAVFLGDYESFTAHLKEVTEYLKENKQSDLIQLNEMIEIYLSIRTGVISKEQFTIKKYKENIYLERPMWAGRNLLISAVYWLTSDEYVETLRILSELDYVLKQRKLWSVNIISHVLKSIAYFNLNKKKEAMDNLHIAYELSYSHNINVPFIEFGRMILPVIKYIQRNKVNQFSKEWVEEIIQGATKFNENVQKLVNVYKIENKKTFINDKHLSPREKTVLYYLVQGYTRDDIGREMNISINGVKKHLTNIYNKLGAKNRAEAIYFATKDGIIEN
ncbi:MAG: response regulator transcription factor [Coprobacillaceae bacterium]